MTVIHVHYIKVSCAQNLIMKFKFFLHSFSNLPVETFGKMLVNTRVCVVFLPSMEAQLLYINHVKVVSFQGQVGE